eukprot:9490289-Pyramimonas_sp.AAC.1
MEHNRSMAHRNSARRNTAQPLARYVKIDTLHIAIARRPIKCLENVAMPYVSVVLSGFVGPS